MIKCFIHLIGEVWVYFLLSRGCSLHLSPCSGKAWDACTPSELCSVPQTALGLEFSLPGRPCWSTAVNAGLSLLIRWKTPWLHKEKAWADQQTQIWVEWAINLFWNDNCRLALVAPILKTVLAPWYLHLTAQGLGFSSFPFPPFLLDAFGASTPHLQLFLSEPRSVPSHNY